MQLSFRLLVLFEAAGLVINKGDRVAVHRVVAGQREQLTHSIERNEDTNVGGVVLLVTDHGEHADHFEVHAVEQNGIAHGRPAGKHVARHLTAKHADAAALLVIFIVNPTAHLQGNGTNVAVNGNDAGDLAVGTGVVADRANVVASDQGRDIDGEARFILDGKVIVVSQVEPLHGVEASFDRRCAPAKKEDDVFAEGFELFAVAGAEAFADAHQQEERADAPGDAKHGEEGTQLVRPESAQGLPADVQQHAHESPPNGRLAVPAVPLTVHWTGAAKKSHQ